MIASLHRLKESINQAFGLLENTEQLLMGKEQLDGLSTEEWIVYNGIKSFLDEQLARPGKRDLAADIMNREG